MARNKSQRNTRQREVILEALRQTTSHPTAAQLYEIVRRRLPKVSLGTIYRNLELLEELGKIRKLQLAPAEARFDGDPHPHDHIRCVRCGRIDDVPAIPLDLSGSGCDDWVGYEVHGRHLEFFGVCSRCRNSVEKQGPVADV